MNLSQQGGICQKREGERGVELLCLVTDWRVLISFY